MGDLINTIVANPLAIVFVAFIVFCLIKGGNSGKKGDGGNNSGSTGGNTTTTQK